MKILLILKLCLAGLRIWSPDPLTLLDIDNAVATFGDPFAFPRYGKLVPLYYSGDCSFSQIFETNTFAILYGFNHCYSSDLALSVQEFGGIGIIIVADDDNIDYIINPKDNFSSSLIKILVIAIKKSDGAAIFQYFPSQIWVTYSLVIEKIQASKSDFHMSSNYTLDKIFASAFQDISNQFSMSLNQFDITFCFLTPAAENIDSINDCLTSSSNTYCLPHTSTVTGSQKIYNSAAIINHYNTLSGSASEFFIFLTTLYSTCEFDYSISCIQTVLANFPNDQIINTSLTAFKTTSPLINSSPFYKFNGISYYWPDYIEKIYCLSLIVPPSDCKSCSPGCSYLDLLSSTCEENCNNDSCGYDMLTCVKFSSCYNFISGDGNCNSACSCDPDCGCGEDSCSIGCLYSIMNEGFCPLACTGDCFAYCSSDYCSPECSYLDMADGNCPENCSQNCKEKCGSEYCSPGCYYDDIASGLCPDNCKYECFSKCDSDYCSEECMYDDMDDQYCPDICAGRCCEAKINSGLPFYIWIVIVIVAVILIILGIIPCCYLYKNWKLTRGNLDRDLYPRENPREIINRLPYPERNQLPIANPGGYIYQEPNSEMSILSESFHWMNRYPNVGRNLPPSENLINNLYQERNLIRNIQPIENPNHVRNPLPIGNLGNQIPHLERNIPAVPGPNPNKSPRHKKRSSRCNSKAIRTKTLKSVKFHSKMRFDGDPICTIDMSDFTTGELAIIIPTCKHIFHSPCITEWLNSGARKYCPNCRSDLTGWTFSSNLD